MTTAAVTTAANMNQGPQAVLSNSPSKVEMLMLAAGLLIMYVPTFVALDKEVWSIVGQGHGPVMLALSLWLAWQRWPTLLHAPPAATKFSQIFGWCSLFFGLFIYVIGRSQHHFGMHVSSLLFVLAALLLVYRGWPGLKVMWFPLAFAVTLVPLPGSMVDLLTGPLKAGVSYVAESLLYYLGYPIGRAGVTLTIGPYQLLVADACAGLNSIFALEAIGVFYMSVMQHTNRARNLLLAALIIPISFIANVTRVVTLVLITYYFGDEAGQGFVHGFAGILLFMVATALTIAVDGILSLFLKNKNTQEPSHAT